MKIEDPAERPATNDLFDPTVAPVEEDGLPHAIDLERLADVVVAGAIIQIGVVRVGLHKLRTGTDIHALGPGELGVALNLVGKLML